MTGVPSSLIGCRWIPPKRNMMVLFGKMSAFAVNVTVSFVTAIGSAGSNSRTALVRYLEVPMAGDLLIDSLRMRAPLDSIARIPSSLLNFIGERHLTDAGIVMFVTTKRDTISNLATRTVRAEIPSHWAILPNLKASGPTSGTNCTGQLKP